MTNADRLANFNGWTHHPTIHHKSGMVTSNHWTKRVGDKVVTSYDHPMSTLDAVAASLPEGWRWERIGFNQKGWHAIVEGGSLVTKWKTITGCPTELEARTSAALAAWEVSSAK